MSQSSPFQGVSATGLSGSFVPVASREGLCLWWPGGWRSREEAGRLCGGEGATRVAGRGPRLPLGGHPGRGSPPHRSAYVLAPATEQHPPPRLAGAPPAAPARAGDNGAGGHHLLHCTLSKPVAALFSSSVVFCSCMDVLAASSGSLLRSMITISISRSKHRDRDEPRQLHGPRFTDTAGPQAKPEETAPNTSSKGSTTVTGTPATGRGQIRQRPEPLSLLIPAMPRSVTLTLTPPPKKNTNCSSLFNVKVFFKILLFH